MKVIIARRPNGSYNGEVWPEVGEPIELPDHVAEGMLATGEVVKPGSAEAKEAKAEAAEDEKARKEAEAAQAKVDAAKAAAEEAEQKAAEVEAAVAAPPVETAARKTTPRKR